MSNTNPTEKHNKLGGKYLCVIFLQKTKTSMNIVVYSFSLKKVFYMKFWVFTFANDKQTNENEITYKEDNFREAQKL